jgi:hypothetical protein
MPVAKLTLTFLDSQNSTSKVTIPLLSLSSTNFDSVVAQAAFGVAGTLAKLIATMSIGTPISSEISLPAAKGAKTLPTNKYSQRELGLQIGYSDTVTGKNYRMTIPAPDWDTIGIVGSNKVNTASAPWVALVASMESNMVSELGNPIAVTGGKLIGRK